MHSARHLFLAVLSSILVCCFCHEAYQAFIPNGDQVPHPCNASEIWGRVGHLSQNDANTTKNAFGLAFSNAKQTHGLENVWGHICSLDSDGDGRTNGEELGDSACTWTYGQNNPNSTNISHPGFNETAYRALHNC